MSKIHVDFTVGAVAAFYFIVFDLFLLTIVDIVLSHVANHYYYRQISRGHPLLLNTTDIPGIATFLVGRFFSLHNIISLSIKLIFILCIVLIERGIDAEFVDVPTVLSRRATFIFDPSDNVWEGTHHRAVSRRWERIRTCRQRAPNSYTNLNTNRSQIDAHDKYHVDFYHIAYNLSNGRIIDDEIIDDGTDPIYEIDDTTIECLAPTNVLSRDVRHVAQITGCSQLFPNTDCRNETLVRIPGVNEFLQSDHSVKPTMVSVEAGTGNVSLSVHTHRLDDLRYVFPQLTDDSRYGDPEMTCAKTQIGPPAKFKLKKILRSCLLIVPLIDASGTVTNTLIERWTHDEKGDALVRHFPGPVFKGVVDYGLVQRANHLINLIISLNWETLAATLIADAMVYRRINWTFRTYQRVQRTVLPTYAIALGVALLALTVIARIVVRCSIEKDERPQINSIDGLSSIAREEMQPSGRSLVAGHGVMLGLSHRGFGQPLHFGPLLSANDCVKRSAGELVE